MGETSERTERAGLSHSEITEKWQHRWAKAEIFRTDDSSKKKKFYVLEMYPYPSASGLHMGHALNYTIGDIYARMKIMQGFNVLHPMGFDSFGLPAENAAIKAKSHPKKFTDDAVANYIRQMKGLGLSYDWSRMVETHKPDYYKWDQWIFLKMYEKGLAYKKTSPVNWCPLCNTVLANEQVHDGKCWRHEDTKVEVKNLEQWFFKTTAYADELYKGIDKLTQWPDMIKKLQRNWIGKSHGTEIIFKINGEDWKIFTTRPDTLFGVTFLVISAQHHRLHELVTPEHKAEVEKFLKKIHSVKQEDIDQLEKEGVFTGSYAEHPLTKEKVPVYAGNFVLADYGSGMVMAVPAHDQRDYEFAVKYNIPIKWVISENDINCVLIHGSPELNKSNNEGYAGESHKHWFTWIKNQLENINIKTLNPNMPKPWHSEINYELWRKEFEKININENSILVGHSAGGAFIVRWLSENPRKIKKLILVAAAKIPSDINSNIAKLYDFKINNKLRDLIGETIVFVSNDNERHQEAARIYAKELNGKLVRLENRGHFVLRDMGTEEFPELLEEITSRKEAFTDYGVLFNSGKFDNLTSEEAKERITEELHRHGLGKKVTNFKLRDWLISRQRFWGTPIPVVYCDECGTVPVPEKDLPVELPNEVKFADVKNPLTDYEPFIKTKCPKCHGPAKRETDTMDTFVNSSWYYLRYADPKNDEEIFEGEKAKLWAPIDMYIGGKEHACMHLIYIRFYTKFLRDLGLLDFDEPAIRLFNQGMLQGSDGEKMSKSKGNVILPETVSEKYGLDAARLFLVSVASPDKDINWSDKGVEGSVRFINKVINYVENVKLGKTSKKTESKLNRAIKEVTENIEGLQYNIAVIKIRELFDSFEEEISKEDLEKCLKLLAPICPHTMEEMWEKIGNKGFISQSEWPEYDEDLIDDKIDYLDKVYESLKEDIKDVLKMINIQSPSEIKIIISPDWKYEFVKEFKEIFLETKEFKEISQKMLAGKLKQHGQEIMKMLPGLIKDQSKLPEIIISSEEEKENLELNRHKLESEFKCEIIIEKADNSQEQKAKNAWPCKPALVVK